MANFSLVYSPRAQRDLRKLPAKEANQILNDLEKLTASQRDWPMGQVKKLQGHPYWEIKTGDFRALFICQKQKIVILRVVNRRELEREIKRIDWRWIMEWLKQTL